jgi:replicative DNA helicase
MIEETIIKNLITNESFLRKVIPFIKEEYFQGHIEKEIFKEIHNYVGEYSNVPSKEALIIGINKRNNITDDVHSKLIDHINSISPSEVDVDWLVNETEQFCKDRSVYNAVLKSISIIDGKEKDLTPDALPSILSDALSVSFDSNVGHDYYDSAEDRFDFYHRKEEKIPFDIDILNKITKGGLPNKSLLCWMSGTGVGKSLVMCHQAAAAMEVGSNVLYITLEMSEERIAERIDANLMDVNIVDVPKLNKFEFDARIDKVKKKCRGKLIVKEYPTSSAHVGHFEHLLDELRIKKSFKPDIIFVDYINLCTSKRFKSGSNHNSYTIIKSIAEELRGLSVVQNLPIVTATQVNRSGAGDADIDLTNTAESFGLPATVDLMLALISTEDLEEMNQIMIKQLKNRYNDVSYYKRFTVGIDRSKMRLYDLEPKAQDGLVSTKGNSKKEKSQYSGFVI